MLDVVGRRRSVTFFRDPSWAAGRKQAIFTIHDQNFVDEYGLWLAADESLVDDGLEGFALKVDRLRHKLRVANDCKRRWYPRRNVAGEYIEFGAPQYWTGTQWKALTLGTPSRPNTQTLLWDRTNFSFELIAHWRQIKLNIVLKNSGAARRVRWPVSLVGLSWQNWNLIGMDGQSVGSVVPPWGTDANGTAVPISNSYSGGYVEFTADLSGLVYPIAIDPTFTTQPDGTVGVDTFMNSGQPTTQRGTATTLFASYNGQTRKALLKFNEISDTNNVPEGSTCNSATFTPNFSTTNVPRVISVYSLHSNVSTWDETATWTNYTGSTAWPGSAGCSTADTDYESTPLASVTLSGTGATDFSLTASRIEGWFGATNTNYGILVYANNTTATNEFYSSDYATAGNRPKVVVDFTAPPSSGVTKHFMFYSRMRRAS